MKRLFLLLLLAVSVIGGQTIVNCSKPLDPNLVIEDPDSDPIDIDTVYIYDTVFSIDTITSVDTIFGGDTTFVYDTTFSGDTILVIDTLIRIDTVVIMDTIVAVDTVIVTDTVMVVDTITIVDTFTDTVVLTDTLTIVDTMTISPTFCAKLSSSNKTITWLLQNQPGQYELEFEVEGTESKPEQQLVIEIDGNKYYWVPADNHELELKLELGKDTRVLIYSTEPHAFGHPLDICLEVESED